MTRNVTRELALDVSALVVTVGLLIAVGAGLAGPARVLLALAFVTFVPGWALLDRVPLAAGASKVALAVPLSFAIGGGSATLILVLRSWVPLLLLYALAASCVVLIVSHAATLLNASRTYERPA